MYVYTHAEDPEAPIRTRSSYTHKKLLYAQEAPIRKSVCRSVGLYVYTYASDPEAPIGVRSSYTQKHV